MYEDTVGMCSFSSLLGGGPVSSFLYAKALAHAGHIVQCISVQDNELYEEYDGIPVHRVSSPNIYWDYYKPHPAWQRLVWHVLENSIPRRSHSCAVKFGLSDQTFWPQSALKTSTWQPGLRQGRRGPGGSFHPKPLLMCWRAAMFKNGRNCRSRCPDCGLFSVGKKLLSQLVDGVQAGDSRFVLDAHMTRGYFGHAIQRVIPCIVNALAPARQPPKRPVLRVG